jgi:hypothetical protein
MCTSSRSLKLLVHVMFVCARREEFTRTLVEGGKTALETCMLRIGDLSQTCDLYDACGPVSSYQPSFGRTSVCHDAEGYYKEEAVQRMCGA